MNKCILVGNLTRDPEVSTTGSGISICKFFIAVNRDYQNAEGEREADFLNITAWRKLGENCGKYLSKGSKVAVCGSIQTRIYEVEGQKRYATDIIAESVEFLTKGIASESKADKKAGKTDENEAEFKAIDGEVLPF